MKAFLYLFVFISIIIVFSTLFIHRYEKYPVSDHYDGKRFFNRGLDDPKDWTMLLKWFATREPGEWPEFSENEQYDVPPERVEGNELRVSFVNHATVLVQTQGLNILMDPFYSDRASPVSFAGPKRVHPPGINMEDLPPIDMIIVTHNHYDHMDFPALEKLKSLGHNKILTPLGNASIMHKAIDGLDIQEVDLGQSIELKPGVSLHAEPCAHWSSRGWLDKNKALWAAFVLKTSGGNVYMCSDTAFGKGAYFKQIQEKYGSFRLAILPIGSYKPRWFMKYSHVNPAEALRLLSSSMLGTAWAFILGLFNV